jgi:hypothetical protein
MRWSPCSDPGLKDVRRIALIQLTHNFKLGNIAEFLKLNQSLIFTDLDLTRDIDNLTVRRSDMNTWFSPDICADLLSRSVSV